MQSVEFTVAFLNSMLSAIHQHINFEDLEDRKHVIITWWESVEGIMRYQHKSSVKNDQTSNNFCPGHCMSDRPADCQLLSMSAT